MTPDATHFITPLTLSTLSRRPVYHRVASESGWNNHVELGLWADAMVVAPATATTLAKMAQGLSNSMVVATYLSARCPVFFAPAMDLDMWIHPATRRNVESLQNYGNHLIPVEYGELASGLVGSGRMAEPEHIVSHLADFFRQTAPLAGQQWLVTAGPTYEPIDPVRFIGNHSSGKMGVAVAEAAARQGATVELVLGPSALYPEHERLNVHRVTTAREMLETARPFFAGSQVSVFAAAVADYRPLDVAPEKIKKADEQMQIALVRNPDIAAHLGAQKQAGQVTVGFALETENEAANARAKLDKKNFDLLVLNSLRDQGAGFGHPTNRVTIFSRYHNKTEKSELKTKAAVAEDIIEAVVSIQQRQKIS